MSRPRKLYRNSISQMRLFTQWTSFQGKKNQDFFFCNILKVSPSFGRKVSQLLKYKGVLFFFKKSSRKQKLHLSPETIYSFSLAAPTVSNVA